MILSTFSIINLPDFSKQSTLELFENTKHKLFSKIDDGLIRNLKMISFFNLNKRTNNCINNHIIIANLLRQTIDSLSSNCM